MTFIDLDFLRKIIATGSPTGREQELQRYIREWAAPFAGRIEADAVGNLAVVVNPDAPKRVMLAGHCDRIGFMVMKITRHGCLRVDALGGVDEATVLGSRVIVHTRQGEIPGVIGKVSTHLQKPEDKESVTSIDRIWIDIGAKDKQDAARHVTVGDYVSYHPEMITLLGSRVSGPGLDNMLGLYVILHVAKECAARDIDVALYCVSTVQEEIGARGAQTAANAIRPEVAIAVDTALAMDTPGKPKTITTNRLKLGAGPSILEGPSGHARVTRLLQQAAEREDLPYQKQPNSSVASNDAKTMQLADIGTASGSVGIPLRNMHTQVELADLDDVAAAIRVLVSFVCSLKADTDYFPLKYDETGEKLADGGTINLMGQ